MPARMKNPIPDDWNGVDWRLVVFCVPDSIKWRGLAKGKIYELTRGRGWDEETGNIKDTQAIAWQIFESLDMTCGDDIKRIADTLENIYDAQYINIDDLIELLPPGKWAKWLSVLGEYSEALNFLTPGLNLQLPKTDIFTMIGTTIFRKKVTEGINEVALQLQSLNTSTAGPGAKTIIDNLRQLLPADDLVDWVLGDLDETAGTIGDELLTLISGNYMTRKLGQIRETIEACCKDTNINIAIEQQPLDVTVVSIGPANDPSGETFQFPDTSSYLDAKCNAANAIYDTIHDFADDIANSNIEELLSGSIGGVIPNLIVKLDNAGRLGWAIAQVLNGVTSLAAKLLGSVTINFNDIASALTEQHSDLICALYSATDTLSAKQDFLDTLALAATSLTAIETDVVTDLLTNDLLNQLFEPRDDVAAYVSANPIDCSACSCITMNVGLIVSGTAPGQVEFTSVFQNGLWRLSVSTDAQVNIQIVSVTGHTPSGIGDGEEFGVSSVDDGVTFDLYLSDTSFVGQSFVGARRWYVRSSTQVSFITDIQTDPCV